MKVRIKSNEGERELPVRIAPNIVMTGGEWRPGAIIDDQSFEAECVACAINEGRRLWDVWEEDPDSPPFSFVISEATSEELRTLLLDGLPAEGSVIRTEDGYTLTVAGSEITDGDLAYATLGELDVDFTLSGPPRSAA